MKALKHYPALLGAVALILEILISVIVAPIIDDIRSQHQVLQLEITERMERLEAEIQAARLTGYQQFETQQSHEQDTEKLLQRIIAVEKRTYELKH